MMYRAVIILGLLTLAHVPYAAIVTTTTQKPLQKQQVNRQVEALQSQINRLESKLEHLSQKLTPLEHQALPPTNSVPLETAQKKPLMDKPLPFHQSTVTVHSLDKHPEALEFYPTVLLTDNHILTYIAGTPIVASPYIGNRPAFDGSDYIINISSINRDVRMMQQRRYLYRAYERLGYDIPNVPILALSGKVQPIGVLGDSYTGDSTRDLNLDSSELDVAAAVNDKIEAYLALAYDSSAPPNGGPRVTNSALRLRMGFINIGDLDESPYYFTAGQLFVPFGNFASAMASAPLVMIMGRTMSRPFILGYKSQADTGPFAAAYLFESDTTLGDSGISGVNLGYIFKAAPLTGQLVTSYIASITNTAGMQYTGSAPYTTFGGFGSLTNGNEAIRKTPAWDINGYVRFNRYNLSAEWLTTTKRFREQDLSYNGKAAQPQAGLLEAGATFALWGKPSSLAAGYQWSREALALNLPEQRINAIFNISIWRDTIEGIEYRHDIDYKTGNFGNGAAPTGTTNANTIATGASADSVLISIAVYF